MHDLLAPPAFAHGAAAARDLGARLVVALAQPAALDVLAVSGGTWTAGGCWILAAALRCWLDPWGELVAISRPHPVEHVVVRLGGWYLDGHGASTATELLGRWRGSEDLPRASLVVFTPKRAAAATRDAIPCSTEQVTALRDHLAASLGSSARWVAALGPAVRPNPGQAGTPGRALRAFLSGRPADRA